jgi:mannose-1-phosphate guanylyltransferase / mannose-6-phosphate isomerase
MSFERGMGGQLARPVVPLILCGGAGTRLWPASRGSWPKQFLPLFGSHSTFQETVRRVSDPARFSRPVVVTNHQYRFLVAEQLAEIGVEGDILLEPVRRDSGPAIVAGAAFASKRDGDALVVALAADHIVTDAGAFAEACGNALQATQAGQVVTFGLRPTRPATEFGYIRVGDALGPNLFAIERFVEKPDAETAARYVAENYLWNSGNFMFSARFLIEEYRRFEPDSAVAVLTAVETAGSDLGFFTLEPKSFAAATARSIDYAVMERTDRAAVMPVSYGWSDVGSWQTVWELSSRDAEGNAAQGAALFFGARNSYVASEKQLVALCGLDNVVVIATDDAILVSRREDSAGLRQIVKKLGDVAPKLIEDHQKVRRPWGSYQSVDRGDRFQVKRIVVKKGGRLSLQMHHHRAEHWIVVRGTARVTIGDNITFLHENESVYVPSGARHRLENPGKIDLELIEVQTGSYLDEDDIIRFEDDYRRP